MPLFMVLFVLFTNNMLTILELLTDVIYNGVQMSTTYYTSSQIKELSVTCNKALDKQVLASNPLDTTLNSESTCNGKNLKFYFCFRNPNVTVGFPLFMLGAFTCILLR